MDGSTNMQGYIMRKSFGISFVRCVLLTAGVFCVVVGLVHPLEAQQLINLTFGATAYSGNTETSPATPTGTAGVWNSLSTGTANAEHSYESDAAAVLYADGSAGPTLTFDASSSGSGGVWSASSLSLSTVDYTTVGGVYDVANLYESGLINSGNNTTGFRLKGLAAGTYEVFMVPFFRGSQAAGTKADANVTFSVGLGSDNEARNVGNLVPPSPATTATQNIDTRLTTWVAPTDGSTAYNYIGATVTIDSPERWLTFLFPDSSTVGPDRPGPSTIQIRSTGTPVDVIGDFNQNGRIDAGDYTDWRDNLGREENLPNSGVLTGPVGQDHYELWKVAFGNAGNGSVSIASGGQVPEPSALLIAFFALAISGGVRRKRQ
jgi:hypothetical protein